MRLRHAAALALFGALTTSCMRKAPTPHDCERLALSWYGLDRSYLATRQELPSAVRELTLSCLRRPFPRDFVHCVHEMGRSAACRVYWTEGFDQAREVP